MRGLKLVLLAGLAACGIGMATSAEAACVLKGKGTACKGGLSAMSMLVTDKDWQKKWNTSRESTPEFHTTDELGEGESATLLTFFVSDKSGPLELSCDLAIKDSTGKTERYPMQLCFRAEVIAGDIYMTGAQLTMNGDGETGSSEFIVGLKSKSGGKLTLKTGVRYAQ